MKKPVTLTFLRLRAQGLWTEGQRLNQEDARYPHPNYLHTEEIKGYAKTLSGVARASKLLKAGTALEIIEACSVGREDECTEAKYVEGAKLVGGVVESQQVYLQVRLEVVLPCLRARWLLEFQQGGLGAIACAIVGGAVAGYYGGLAGEEHFAPAGKFLYEHRP
jgi:hypothetical protein